MSEAPVRPDPDAPNESAPGHEIPHAPSDPEPLQRPDPDAPNESAPGHAPDRTPAERRAPDPPPA
jgi:hypothetical protein